jgi:threonyl-tRNA synthetase
MKDALVVFAAVEESDENSRDAVAQRSIGETVRVCNQLGARNVVVYPFAHLTSNLAKPQTALWILRRMEELLKERGYQTLRAPFGWYKRLELKTKGHPLSELSRRITV